MEKETRELLVLFIVGLLFCFYVGNPFKKESFTLGLASGSAGNGANFNGSDLIKAATPCCKGDSTCENQKTLLSERVNTDHTETKKMAAAELADAAGSVEESPDPTSALWFFSNYRPLAECTDCKGLGNLSLSTEIEDTDTGDAAVAQRQGIINTVDITDREGRTDDYKPSREWIAARCLEDPDCTGFQLDRAEGTAKLIGTGSALKQIEDPGQEGATDIYFLHPYRALKWQLEGKTAPGDNQKQGNPKESFEWKARIRKLSTTLPQYNEDTRHDSAGVLKEIPGNTEWTDSQVRTYGNDRQVAKANRTLVKRRKKRLVAKKRAEAEEIIRQCREAISKINLNPSLTAMNNKHTQAAQTLNTVTTNQNNYNAWVAETTKRAGPKNAAYNNLVNKNGDVTRAQASWNEANGAEAHHRGQRDHFQRLRDSANSSRHYWQHDWGHNCLDKSNHYVGYWLGLQNEARGIRDQYSASFNAKKGQYSSGGWEDSKRTQTSGGWETSKNKAKNSCKGKYGQVFNNLSAADKNIALSCKEVDYKIVTEWKNKNKKWKGTKTQQYWKYGIHKNEYKLFKGDTATERNVMKVWGWKGKKGANCNWQSIKNNNLSKGSHNSDCGDCRDNNNCHTGTYGVDWGRLSHRKQQKEWWEGQRNHAQNQINHYWRVYNDNEAKRAAEENSRAWWAGQKTSRLGGLNASKYYQRIASTGYTNALNHYNASVNYQSYMLNVWNNSKAKYSNETNEYLALKAVYDGLVAEIARLNAIIQEQLNFLNPVEVVAATSPPPPPNNPVDNAVDNIVDFGEDVLDVASDAVDFAEDTANEIANQAANTADKAWDLTGDIWYQAANNSAKRDVKDCLKRISRKNCKDCCNNKFNSVDPLRPKCKEMCDKQWDTHNAPRPAN